MKNTELIAVCGLYCGACGIYQATQDKNEAKLEEFARGLSERTGKEFTLEDVRCDGCLVNDRLDLWCQNCQIRVCEKLQSGKIRCSDCTEFPCKRLTDFRDDGMAHHSEITDNLKQLREMGIKLWTEYEENRWTCPECKTILSWYDSCCPGCGVSRPKLLFDL
jgi:benzoyl-CoA reductase/2-hydroxyglutaryl-CoA dehydratase subunit BcrC/BadD/HgdB